MTLILAIDPGNKFSAFVLLDTETRVIRAKGKHANEDLLHDLRELTFPLGPGLAVIEKVESFGMAVGAEVFETVYWSGRFAEALDQRGIPVNRIGRKAVKLHLCGQPRAKDSNIRQAVLDLYGGKSAIGKKKTPGPLYGVSNDIWSALAVGVTFAAIGGSFGKEST